MAAGAYRVGFSVHRGRSLFMGGCELALASDGLAIAEEDISIRFVRLAVEN
jgi:hypothetical protein